MIKSADICKALKTLTHNRAIWVSPPHQILQQNPRSSLVFKSIKYTHNVSLAIGGLTRGILSGSTDEWVMYGSSELHLQSSRGAWPVFCQGMVRMKVCVVLYHKLLLHTVSNKFLEQNFPRKWQARYILFSRCADHRNPHLSPPFLPFLPGERIQAATQGCPKQASKPQSLNLFSYVHDKCFASS